MIQEIKIEDYAVIKTAEIKFTENKGVYPIIGLNGVGKSIFLNIIENIMNMDYKPEIMNPKFHSSIENIKPQIQIKISNKILKDFKPVAGFKKIFTDKIYDGNIGEESKEMFDGKEGFSILYKYPLLDDEFLLLPFKITEPRIEKILELKGKQREILNKTMSDFSDKAISELKGNMQEIIVISQDKARELIEVISGAKDIFNISESKDPITFDFINTILSIYDENWRKILEDNKIEWEKDNHEKTDQHNKIAEEVNNEIIKFLSPSQAGVRSLPEKEEELLEKIMLTISGRDTDTLSTSEEIKNTALMTRPFVRLWITKGSYLLKLGFNEIDNLKSKLEGKEIKAEYEGLSSKNDGYKFIFYLIYIIKFKNINRNSLILIDELGNFLNPKLIRHLMTLLNEIDCNIVYTTHNPYALNLQNINQIHICQRLRSEPYSEVKHIKHIVGRGNVYNSIINSDKANETIKIIEHALTLETTDIDLRISNYKPNIFLEGITDWVLFSKVNNSKDLNFIPMAGKDNLAKHFYGLLTLNNGGSFGAILDADAQVKKLLDYDYLPKEFQDHLHSKVSLLNDLYNGINEIEDIFIKTKFEFVGDFMNQHRNELVSQNSENFKRINEIKDAKLRKKLKRIIAKETFEIMNLNNDELIKRNPKYTDLLEIINTIVKEYLNINKGNNI